MLLPQLAEIRPTATPLVHLTVRYLGQVSIAVHQLARVGRQVASRTAPLELTGHTLTAFPSAERPQVIALMIERTAVLDRLVQDLDERLGDLRLPERDHPFRPHLSLGRVRRRVAFSSRGIGPVRLPIESLALVASAPGSDQADYTFLERSPFHGA